VARGLEQDVSGLRRPKANGAEDQTISGRKPEMAVSLPNEETRFSAGQDLVLSIRTPHAEGKSAMKNCFALLSA
jgi:hypothetical protein